MRIDKNGRRLDWTPLQDVSQAMQSALVAGEDHRFYAHRGVDWIAMGGSIWSRIRGSHARGASTISMQLASLLCDDLRTSGTQRSPLQKLRQMKAAISLERTWSKDQVLEAYLNLVTFRGELQGVAAASRGLFGKSPQGLTDLESVVLTALIRSPNAPVESVSARACRLARTLNPTLSQSQVAAVAEGCLSRPYHVQPSVALAPHVALRLLGVARKGGNPDAVSVVCTLDKSLQSFAFETVRHHVLSAHSKNMHDGSALVVDNDSGEILAYVGNIGAQSSARFVDGVMAMRQAGSALKPFIYALAFDRRILTPVSLIDDSPIDIPVAGSMYRPQNYDNRFHGLVTARVALASSLNVPAVKTLSMVGVDPFVETLQRLDFRNIGEPDYYGLSIALGSADVTLWDLVAAYRALANGGVWTSMRLTTEEAPKETRRIVSSEAAFLIADVLSDRESRSRTFSLESPLATRYWTAVKTGTSKDMRDNWCVGFSERYTVGVWAGNFSGQPMWNVSGVTGAAPVWLDIMNWLHGSQSSHPPKAPSGVVQRAVRLDASAETRVEWFLRGTEADIVKKTEANTFARIAYPTTGTVIALDPDIPSEEQKMFFEAKPNAEDMQWVLDGKNLGTFSAIVPWAPRRGKHLLVLVDSASRELDSVIFEVRGDDAPLSKSGRMVTD
jgi:penicillin-binding protein 1C